MIYQFTRTGDRHILRRAPCDDSVAAVQFGNYSALILSDGCSSSPFGGDSSRRITNRLADLIRRPNSFLSSDTIFSGEDFIRYCMNPENAEACLWLLFGELDKEAQAMCRLFHCRRKDLCCTLAVAFVEFHPDRINNSAVVITVGDGFVAAHSRKYKDVTLISRGENRCNNPNMTYFCTSENASDNAHIYYIDDFDELLLSSDGITHVTDIDSQCELNRLMSDIASSVGVTDIRFSNEMNRILSDYVQMYTSERNLDDDCGIIYYSTDKKSIRRLNKKTRELL